MTKTPTQWAEAILRQQGMVLLDKPKLIRDMPWSRVEQLTSSQGHVYYQTALNAYLSVWRDFGDSAELPTVYELAKRIRPLVFAMSFTRINACKGIENYPQYRGYIAEALRAFMV